MNEKPELPEFYDDIEKYLEYIDNSISVNVKGFDELIYKIVANTGITYEAASLILKHFFQEIRNSVLRGDTVAINRFGRFFISSPKSTDNKKKIFVKFVPSKILIDKINE